MIEGKILDSINKCADILDLHLLTIKAKIEHQGEELPTGQVKNLVDIAKNLHAAYEALQDRDAQDIVVRFTDSESKPQYMV
jgi:hypothetical protein